MTFKNNSAPLLSTIKLYASFHHHMWIQTGVTVRKRLSWVLTSVTLTFDLWPWPFAWTSLLSLVINPENFRMIWWREHGEKGVTDRQTDGRTDWTSHIAAWSQLKIVREIDPEHFKLHCSSRPRKDIQIGGLVKPNDQGRHLSKTAQQSSEPGCGLKTVT